MNRGTDPHGAPEYDLKDRLVELLDEPHSNKELREKLFPNATTYVKELDAALQKLRREGLIEIRKGKWQSSNNKTCTHCGGRGRVKAKS